MDFTIYPGEPWHADETEDSVRLFCGNLQIAKIPKQSEEYECYWPTPEQIEFMLKALNSHQK